LGPACRKASIEGALPGIKFALGENPNARIFPFPDVKSAYPASRMASKKPSAPHSPKPALQERLGRVQQKSAAGEKTSSLRAVIFGSIPL